MREWERLSLERCERVSETNEWSVASLKTNWNVKKSHPVDATIVNVWTKQGSDSSDGMLVTVP